MVSAAISIPHPFVYQANIYNFILFYYHSSHPLLCTPLVLLCQFVVIALLVAYLSLSISCCSTKEVKQHVRITISQRARQPRSQRLDTLFENVHDVVSPPLRPLQNSNGHAGRHLWVDKHPS